jgi:hypothetical protein
MEELSPAYAFLGGASLLMLLVLGVASIGRGGWRKTRHAQARPIPAAELVAAAILRLRVRPFDRMGPGDRAAVLRLLEGAEAAATLPDLRARINLMLAEMASIAGDFEGALERYRAVQRWAPGAAVARTIETLEHRLSPTTPVSARLAA